MHALLQYQKPNGVILGIWQADPTTMLLSQVTAADPLVGYEVLDTEIPATTLLTDYYILDGTLTPKAIVVITADPAAFPADGTTVCQLSVEPFMSCTLVVGSTPQHLTMDDQVIELTADTPQTFRVTLAPMAAYRAMPITVEATAALTAADEEPQAPAEQSHAPQ